MGKMKEIWSDEQVRLQKLTRPAIAVHPQAEIEGDEQDEIEASMCGFEFTRFVESASDVELVEAARYIACEMGERMFRMKNGRPPF